MKKVAVLALFLALVPTAVNAAWWNPFSWKGSEKATTTTPVVAGVSSSRVFNPPSVAELQERIADLEQQLQQALAQVEQLSKKPASAEKAIEKPSTALTEKQISAKVRPALVTLETATSSGSGVFITAQGHILTSAHTIWSQEPSGAVIGAADTVAVTLSNGTKKTARLVGIDEAHDIAVLQISDKTTSAYIKVTHDSGIVVGDSIYILSVPFSNGISTGGSGMVSGIITKKSENSIETNTDIKPLDTGGALVTAQGTLIGIPNTSTCKVIEEMKHCLKFTVTANIIKSVLPKLLDGMRLYKDKKYSNSEEILVRGQLEQMNRTIGESSIITLAISSATGKNSFDYFNSKLGQDEDGGIAKLYVTKLKQISESIYAAMDFLKSKTHDTDIFFINESASIAEMGDYQVKILKQVQAKNSALYQEYKNKVDFWSRKKNEYDAYLTKPGEVSYDYLMEQGLLLTKTANSLVAERKALMDLFSGETVALF